MISWWTSRDQTPKPSPTPYRRYVCRKAGCVCDAGIFWSAHGHDDGTGTRADGGNDGCDEADTNDDNRAPNGDVWCDGDGGVFSNDIDVSYPNARGDGILCGIYAACNGFDGDDVCGRPPMLRQKTPKIR